jgi:hypothetical protein
MDKDKIIALWKQHLGAVALRAIALRVFNEIGVAKD